jgi:hypothetical protein
MEQFFRYDVDWRYLPFWAPVALKPGHDGVRLNDTSLVATFGLLRVESLLSNVEEAHATGPYRWWTSVGARLSLVDDGLTFGTNPHAGVCIHFREKVPSRLRRTGHSALTVTVADPGGLMRALTHSASDPRA